GHLVRIKREYGRKTLATVGNKQAYSSEQAQMPRQSIKRFRKMGGARVTTYFSVFCNKIFL
ncbi:hypothetical protein, partial [Holospora curviuscula]|uniref:hypothetical protein n=1 Tax=Holospora curviuscula TaxID=1082868 RepID=UPI001A9C6349